MALSVGVKDLQTYSVQMLQGSKDSNRDQPNLSIVPAAINPLHYIKDQRNWEWDTALRLVQKANIRTFNKEVLHRAIPRNISELKQGNMMVVKMARNRDPAEELFTYGSSYIFATVHE